MSTRRTWIRAGVAALVIVTASLIPVRVRAQDQHTPPRSGSIDVDYVAGNVVVGNHGGGSITYATVRGSVEIPEQRRGHRRR